VGGGNALSREPEPVDGSVWISWIGVPGKITARIPKPAHGGLRAAVSESGAPE